MKILRSLSVFIIGMVFIFSGTVKAVDPLGSAYKFHDYFYAFGLGWLDSLSLPLGIFLCLAEFLAGFSVLAGLRQKSGVYAVGLLMAFFTPLTLILALTNPVSDCGCFGDAIKLTNWQTFWKNIILLTFTVILFATKDQIRSVFKKRIEWKILFFVAIIFVLFSLGNLRYLPVIDFLPYKTGVKIADKMVIPEGAEPDKYLTTFIYEKDGVKKEFTLDNYPADDTTWHFIDQKTVLLKKGYVPPIHDFSIIDLDGNDLTSSILEDPGSTLLMISKKLGEADSVKLEAGYQTGRELQNNGIRFLIITATSTDYLRRIQNGLNFCTADETTLKTIVRSNPGYLLIKGGVILGKWSPAILPAPGEISQMASDNATVHTSGNPFPVISLITGIFLFLTIVFVRISELKKEKPNYKEVTN